MINEKCYAIIILIAYIMSLLWFVKFYQNAQQAWRWWSCRQSNHLFNEAEKIRAELLQETFYIRRNLEKLATNDRTIYTEVNQDCLKKIDKFYNSLEQLSDRLSPINIEHSLPLAIQLLAELWQSKNHNLKIQMSLPKYWQPNSLEGNFVILKVLDELLEITCLENLNVRAIDIRLQLLKTQAELVVSISYPDKATLAYYSSLRNLDYLNQTFRVLKSGRCSRRQENLTDTWYFRWKERY